MPVEQLPPRGSRQYATMQREDGDTSSCATLNLPSEVPKPPETPFLTSAAHDQWQEMRTEEGEVYYYNESTDESSWEKPEQLNREFSAAV